MKKPFVTSIILTITLLFFSCQNEYSNDVLNNVSVNVLIDMKLPKYNVLQTAGGWVYLENEGVNGIFIINRGVGKPPYKAFDRAVPDNSCTKPMAFDGRLKLISPCDNSGYSIYDGSPQNDNKTHFAREYSVSANDFRLFITN